MTAISPSAKKTFAVCKTFMSALLAGLLCLCATTARAQSTAGTVYGRIMDAGSDKSMPSADISIEGMNAFTQSDQNGFYTINNVPAGEVTVIVAYAGYNTEARIVTVTPGGRVSADFGLTMTTLYRAGYSAADLTDENKDQIVLLEKITVSTDRAGTARAFQEQKNSMNMTNVVATDQFGNAQGSNVADFLKNLPGITLGYDDAGAASTISIGGMDAQYAMVTMDGAEIANAATGDFGADSRQFNFDQISINGIETIEVRKTISADMYADKPAGSVDLRPKSAFDLKHASLYYNVFFSMNSYAMSTGRTASPRGGSDHKLLPGFALTYSTPFNEGRMGLQVNFNRDQTYRTSGKMRTDYAYWDVDMPFVTRVTFTDASSYADKITGGIRFDWKISPYAKMNANFNYNTTSTTFANYVATFNPGGGIDAYYNGPDSSNLAIFRGSDGSGARIRNSGASSYRTGYTDAFDIKFEWKRYRFIFDTQIAFSYSKTENVYSQVGLFSQISMDSVRYHDVFEMRRKDGRSMDWVFKQGPKGILLDQTPPSALSPGTATNAYMNANVSDIGVYTQNGNSAVTDPLPTWGIKNMPSLRANLRWDAPTRFPLWFKTGVTAKRDAQHYWQPVAAGGGKLNNTYQYIGTGIPGQSAGASGARYDNQAGDSATSTVKIGDSAPGEAPFLSSSYFQLPYNFDPHMPGNIGDLKLPFVDRALLYRTFLSHPDWFYMKDDYFRDGKPGYTTADLNAYRASMSGAKNLSETTAAVYLIGTIRPLQRVTVEVGLRYDYTSQSADMLIPLTAPQMQNLYEWDSSYASDVNNAFEYARRQFKDGERTHTETSYAFWLPSTNIKYNFTPNLVGRLSYGESFARVSIDRISGQWKINDGTNPTARGPNPSLTPDHFKTYGASFEYYFEPAGTFTFTYLYRKWKGLSYNEIIVDNNPNDSLYRALVAQYGPEIIEGFFNDNYTVYTFDDSDYENRNIQSLEFQYSQRIPFVRGLRVNAAFTRIIPNWRKTGQESGQMPATPKTASGSINYTYNNFTINLRGLWTDRTWVSLGDERYTMRANYARFTLDLDMTWQITRRFGVYITGNNITNAAKSSYINNPGALYEANLYGSIWQIGIKGQF